MSELRQALIRELQIRRRSRHTISAYELAVRQLAEFHRRSPDRISREDVSDWIHHLNVQRRLADGSINVKKAWMDAKQMAGVVRGAGIHTL